MWRCAPITRPRGKRVSFNEMSRLTGIVPVQGRADPGAGDLCRSGQSRDRARWCRRDDAEAVLGKGYRLQGITAEVVPNGFWPLDFGGALGEPVTRGIAGEIAVAERRRTIRPATALRAAGLPGVEGIDAREAFTRK